MKLFARMGCVFRSQSVTYLYRTGLVESRTLLFRRHIVSRWIRLLKCLLLTWSSYVRFSVFAHAEDLIGTYLFESPVTFSWYYIIGQRKYKSLAKLTPLYDSEALLFGPDVRRFSVFCIFCILCLRIIGRDCTPKRETNFIQSWQLVVLVDADSGRLKKKTIFFIVLLILNNLSSVITDGRFVWFALLFRNESCRSPDQINRTQIKTF